VESAKAAAQSIKQRTDEFAICISKKILLGKLLVVCLFYLFCSMFGYPCRGGNSAAASDCR
jgi:hypothetical protein